jgi:hypothetical protein
MDLQEVGWVEWIVLAQDRGRWWALVNTVINLWVLLNVENFLTSQELVTFPRRTLLHGIST